MPSFIIENFKDPPVTVDVPIEKVSKGTLYQLVLAGNDEAIAYVKKLAKEQNGGKDAEKIPDTPKAETHPGNQALRLKDVIALEIRRQRDERVALEFDPNQARDEAGKWTSDGDSGSTKEVNKSSDKYIDGVGNVDDFLAKNPQHPGEELFEYQARICADLDPEVKHAVLFEIRETYPPVDYIKDGLEQWRDDHGLPQPQVDPLTVPAPLAKGEIVAETFEKLPDRGNDPEVKAAYDDFKAQTNEMWNYMTKPEKEGGLGIKIDFAPNEKGNPYPTAAAQAEDLRENHHMTTQSGLGGEHSETMSTEEYDRFRAVHDVFGHAGSGAGFDRHGEYETYLVHQSMYTGAGARAMATEYHGSNTAIWAGEPGTPGTGKSVLLPESLTPNPWDEHGRLVHARVRSRAEVQRAIAFAKQRKAPPLVDEQSAEGIRYLAEQLHLDAEFATKFDALPWHTDPDKVPRVAPVFMRDVALEFDPDQPRDETGKWTSDGGGGGGKTDEPKGGGGGSNIVKGPGGADIALKPGSKKLGEGAGTPDDPIYVDSDLNLALAHLADDQSIRLDEEKTASTVVAAIGDYAAQLKEHGEDPPDFNLCNVSVEGTNLFCAENKDIPRAEMPQLGGLAVEGTQAAKDAGGAGKSVDGSAAYLKSLEDSDIPVKDAVTKASMLKASQNELDGVKIAGMVDAINNGTFKAPDNPIYVTKDGYLLDGHHRWAAEMVVDLQNGRSGDVSIKTREVGMEIGAAIDYTNQFADDYGIARKKTGE